MTEKEFHKAIHVMHMEQVDLWLQEKEPTMAFVVTTSMEGNDARTKTSRLRTSEDVVTLCKVITREPRPVRRTVLFRSWMIPKDIAYEGGTDKQEMIMLMDGEEFPDGFEMSVGKMGKIGKWGFKGLLQKDEGKYMHLGPEMVWMAYSAKLFTNNLEDAGIILIGSVPLAKLGKVPKGSEDEPPVIIDGLKVESIPMPQVADGMQII
jgi:hypothetical protein